MRILFLLFVSLAAFAQTGVPLKESVSVLVDDPALYMERVDLQSGQHQIKCAAAPIWYPDHSTGELKRVSINVAQITDTVDGETAYSETRNAIQYRCNAAGVSTYRRGPYILRTRLAQIRIENATTETTRTTTATVRPSALLKEASRIIRVNGLLPNLTHYTEIRAGAIKENLVVSSVPDNALNNTEAVLFVFQFDTSRGEAITPTIESGAIVWRNANSQVVFTHQAPYVFDANDAELRSRYLLRAGLSVFAVGVNARDMRLATYPVTIDPTTSTNQAAQTSYLTTYEELGSADDHESMYMEFTLPDLTGETITAATCTLTNTDTGSSISNVQIFCDDQADWSNATGQATLDGFSFGALTDTVTLEGTAGTETFNILGAAGVNGIAKIYGLDGSPDPCTIKVFDSGMGATTDSVMTALRIGSGNSTSIIFIDGSDATSYPYITITYGAVTTIPGRKATGAGIIQ